MARLRWGRREQFLLAQVSSLQGEAQLAALKYQQKLHQYMLNINSIADQVIGFYKGDTRISRERTVCAEETEKREEMPKHVVIPVSPILVIQGTRPTHFL
ncbi:unnamed protein product [Arctogadus glacialis]